MNFFRNTHGAAAIEAALVLPFYLLFIFGIFELGWIFWSYNSMQYAAADAARCNAISSTCNATTTAINRAVGLGLVDGEITATANAACGNYTGTKVTIAHPPGLLTKYIPVLAVTLEVEACYPKPNG